jgi:hypothetical protein
MDNPSDCGTDGVQNKLRTSTFDRGKSRADAIIYSLSNLHFTRKANERASQLKKRDIDIKPKPPSAWPRLSEISSQSYHAGTHTICFHPKSKPMFKFHLGF